MYSTFSQLGLHAVRCTVHPKPKIINGTAVQSGLPVPGGGLTKFRRGEGEVNDLRAGCKELAKEREGERV